MPIMNYTTKVAVDKTAAEVQAILGRSGAASVSVFYMSGQPAGVTFTMSTPAGPREYRLPVDVEAMHRHLRSEHAAGRLRAHQSVASMTSREQAARVAWRVAKDWLEAQVTLVQAQMATLDQVMLPYLLTAGPESRTLYEVFRARELGELTA